MKRPAGAKRPRGVAVVIGTRPEAIKMAPVVRALRAARSARLRPVVVLTGQHRELAGEALRAFGVRADHDLDVMRPRQSLFDTTAAVLTGLERVFTRARPAAVLVQGDTTSAFAGALAAFYLGIPVGHVEAGLRTYDRANPFPEEMNRRLVSALAEYHFAPTARARDALLAEGVPARRIWVTGNTVVDALREIVAARRSSAPRGGRRAAAAPAGSRLLLVTAHRRENWGRPLENLCRALRDIVAAEPDVEVIFPVHPNPNVRRVVDPILGRVERVRLVPPMDYLSFVDCMSRATLILTDSGGIQEEAPSLGKPVLVARAVSERPEGVEAGLVRVVGTSRRRIAREALALLRSPRARERMRARRNPYGDGRAARRIAGVLARELARGKAR